MFQGIARLLADWLRSLPLHIDATALRQLPHFLYRPTLLMSAAQLASVTSPAPPLHSSARNVARGCGVKTVAEVKSSEDGRWSPRSLRLSLCCLSSSGRVANLTRDLDKTWFKDLTVL